MHKPYRLAYFVTHPIQYQAPLLKRLAAEPEIDLTVFFLSDMSTKAHKDAGFNQKIEWDTNLLDGYTYHFIESVTEDRDFSFFNPKVKVSKVIKALNSQQWDAVWIHGYANTGLMTALLWCNFKKIPIFYRADSTLTSNRSKPFKSTFIRYLVKKSTALLWTGLDNRDYYEHFGAMKSQLFFTPHAVDNTFFQSALAVEKKNNDQTIILFASKFIHRKNAPLLLRAFAQLDSNLQQNTELWFIGDGEDKKTLVELIDEHKLANKVKLLGFKNQSELPGYFRQCDLFVLPSEKEPFGLVINEVMNLAKPVIATNEVGAARDLIEHSVNGWVIKAGDLSALTAALTVALKDPKKLTIMGEKSLVKINQWSYQEDINGILKALNSIRDSRNVN